MATNGKPTTSYEISYGPLDQQTGSLTLTPVLIAPKYTVYGLDSELEDGYLGTYDGTLSAASSYVWPGDVHDPNTGDVDTKNVVVYARNAFIALNPEPVTATIAAATEGSEILNKIETEINLTNTDLDAIEGPDAEKIFGKLSVAVGDKVLVKVGKTIKKANIIAIEPKRTTTPSFSISASAVDKVKVDVTSATVTEGISYLIVKKDGTLSWSCVAGYDSVEGSGKVGADGVVGSFGVKITDNGLVDGDRFILNVRPAGSIVSYSNVIVDADLSKDDDGNVIKDADGNAIVDAEVTFISDRYTPEYLEIPSSSLTITRDGVSVAAALSTTVFGAIDGVATVCEAEIVGEFRRIDKCTDISYTLIAKSDSSQRTATARGLVGVAHPSNPAGMMFATACMVEGGFFYMMLIDEDSDEAYAKAFEAACRYDSVYALVPYNNSAAVRAAAINAITEASNKYVAKYKVAWFASEPKKEELIANTDPTTGSAIIAEFDAEASRISFESNIDLVSMGVTKNNIVRVITDRAADGSFKSIDLCVKYVESAHTIVTSSVIPSNLNGLVSAVELVNVLDKHQSAELLAKEAASINNYRVRLVASQNLSWGGFTGISCVYLAGVLAAMRASLAPHAPMNELVVPGFSIDTNDMWNDNDLITMNNGGVWVVATDNNGNCSTYHQITTKTDGTIAEEENVVSNGDHIVRRLRNSVAAYASGKSNVSDALLNLLRVKLTGALEFIRSTNYPVLYGPQILDYRIVSLTIPDSNRQSIICKVEITMPLPLQNGEFEFNLI